MGCVKAGACLTETVASVRIFPLDYYRSLHQRQRELQPDTCCEPGQKWKAVARLRSHNTCPLSACLPTPAAYCIRSCSDWILASPRGSANPAVMHFRETRCPLACPKASALTRKSCLCLPIILRIRYMPAGASHGWAVPGSAPLFHQIRGCPRPSPSPEPKPISPRSISVHAVLSMRHQPQSR